MILVLTQKATSEELEQAREIYPDYIKTVIDVENNILAVGGEFHIDCEEALLAQGSKQENLYGGGYRISNGEVEYFAMSNYKPHQNRFTYEITDQEIRNKLKDLSEKWLKI